MEKSLILLFVLANALSVAWGKGGHTHTIIKVNTTAAALSNASVNGTGGNGTAGADSEANAGSIITVNTYEHYKRCAKNEKFIKCSDKLCQPQSCADVGKIHCTPTEKNESADNSTTKAPCIGPSACVCKTNYVRNQKGICMPIAKCNSSSTTEDNEEDESTTEDSEVTTEGSGSKTTEPSDDVTSTEAGGGDTTSEETEEPATSTTRKPKTTKKPEITTVAEGEDTTTDSEITTKDSEETMTSTTQKPKTTKKPKTTTVSGGENTTTEDSETTDEDTDGSTTSDNSGDLTTDTSINPTKGPNECIGRHEHYLWCSHHKCPERTCAEYLNHIKCPKHVRKMRKHSCINECRCRSGHFRGDDGECWSKHQCKKAAKWAFYEHQGEHE